MKNLKNLGKTLSKNEQKTINGGKINPSKCATCGGFPTPNGGCLGTQAVHCCITGQCR